MTATPMPRKGVMSSCKMKNAQTTATGSSTVIKIPLTPAPIFGMPAAKSAVGIVVPATARKMIHREEVSTEILGVHDALRIHYEYAGRRTNHNAHALGLPSHILRHSAVCDYIDCIGERRAECENDSPKVKNEMCRFRTVHRLKLSLSRWTMSLPVPCEGRLWNIAHSISRLIHVYCMRMMMAMEAGI